MPEEIKELGAEKTAPEPVEMPNAFAEPQPEQADYGSDPDGLGDAAADLDEKRKREHVEEEAPIVQRNYVTFGGEDDGKPRPDHETIDLGRAAEDLTLQRDLEVGIEFQKADEAVAAAVDYNRGQQQPVEQQPTPPVDPQAQQPASDEEMLRSALERPAIRQAMEQQLQTVEAERQRYARAAEEAANLSAAATFSQFDELAGVNIQSLPAVINAVAKNNPQRAQAMVQAIQNTERLHQASRQAQQAQAEIAQTRQAVWMRSEDAKFNQSIAGEPAEVVHEVTREGARVLQESYGITRDGLAELLQTNPGLRTAEAQRLLFDTIKSKLSQEKLSGKKAAAPVPPVIRPGVSRPASSYSDEEATGALRGFRSDPNPRSAAEYLLARRAAAKR